MLEKSLDVLRNKELSFWCHINVNFYDNKHFNSLGIRPWVVTYNKKFILIDKQWQVLDELQWIRPFSDEDKFEIIWHPLTRWRIEYLVTNHKASPDENKDLLYRICINKILDIFTFNNKLFDQTELERMQHDKWNELYPLLVEFAWYFNK